MQGRLSIRPSSRSSRLTFPWRSATSPRPQQLPHSHEFLNRAGAGQAVAVHPASLIGFAIGIADMVLGEHREDTTPVGEIFPRERSIRFRQYKTYNVLTSTAPGIPIPTSSCFRQ